MAENDFKAGRLVWSSGKMDADTLRSQYLQEQVWSDGFLAFSTTEQRLTEGGLDLLSRCLEGRSDAHGGPEGYLMEAGLWRTVVSGLEELAIERDGDNFSVHYWCLYTSPDESDAMECFYRQAKTFVRRNVRPFSGALESVEVVVPEHRLRFYLTKGV